MRKLVLIGLAGIACSEPRQADPPKSGAEVVAWAAIASAPRPGPENSLLVDVDLQVTVSEGWNVYSLTQATGGPTPMSVRVEPPYEIAGEIVGPPVEKAHDPNFGIVTEKYTGEKIFKIPVKLPAGSPVALPPVELKVRSQACSDKLCLPARTTTLTVTPESS